MPTAKNTEHIKRDEQKDEGETIKRNIKNHMQIQYNQETKRMSTTTTETGSTRTVLSLLPHPIPKTPSNSEQAARVFKKYIGEDISSTWGETLRTFNDYMKPFAHEFEQFKQDPSKQEYLNQLSFDLIPLQDAMKKLESYAGDITPTESEEAEREVERINKRKKLKRNLMYGLGGGLSATALATLVHHLMGRKSHKENRTRHKKRHTRRSRHR